MTRLRLLDSTDKYRRVKNFPRFKSIYFDVNRKNLTFKVKSAFRRRNRDFQSLLCRQFKRGIFKVFIETFHEETSRGFSEELDFIRNFARNDIGDYPVLYFKRKIGIIYTSEALIKHPVLCKANEIDGVDQIEEQFNFCEFELLSHRFAIPVVEKAIESKMDYVASADLRLSRFFSPCTELRYLTDIDLTLDMLK